MNIQQLSAILIELRTESMGLGSNPTKYKIEELMHKYNMVFLGEKINCINSSMLCNAINNYFHIKTNNNELNKLIPDVCKCLNMEYEPFAEVSKLGKTSKPDAYKIILW